MGLGKIFVFSVTLGISVSFAFLFSGNANSGLSFFIFDSIIRTAGPNIQILVMLGSLVLAVISIFSMAKMFLQIYENKISGIAVSLLGFFGSILILHSSQGNFQILLLGLGFWIIGIVIVAKKFKSNFDK